MEEMDFKNMMQQSKLEIQFPDFEEQVMTQIKKKEANRRSVWKNLKMSWLFLFIGAFLGIFVTQFLTDIQLPFIGEKSKLVLLIAEIFIVLVVASQFDSLLRFTIKKRDKL
ncbi:hypothetical protein OU798_21150 [Prolixibacteraceae bacterium Z1-6]|uniref:Uncharacterized protein n=1 Tax=Draconibacterium aestuarii TaxID=2998507 RepID=A0A9X3F975_9BACT|nr:hypothetical protein [Prolixibacteraceae bacterium Z1-6]